MLAYGTAHQMTRVLCIVSALIAFGLVGCITHDQQPVLPPAGASPQLFAHYKAGRDSKLAEGWTRGFDMSGVSFNSRKTCTLITPRHVVMARHFQRPVGATITFHDRSGNVIRRTLEAKVNTHTDVAVGLLNMAVPQWYRVYPLPSPEWKEEGLVGQPIAVTDQKRGLFFHRIAAVRSGFLRMQYDPDEKHGWGKKLVSGDSGNPSFIIHNGQLVLAETHTTGGPGAGPYYGDTRLQSAIKDAVKELAPAYRVKIAH